MRWTSCAAAVVALIPVACTRPATGSAGVRHDDAGVDAQSASGTDASSKDSEAPSAALAPLPAQPPFVDVVVPTFPDAFVSVPNGATGRRPVLIVLHAPGEEPERSCDVWRRLTGAHGFVICPRDQNDVPAETRPSIGGDAGPGPYARRGGVALRGFVDVLLDAVGTRYPGYVDGERPIVVASGAVGEQAARLASDDSRRFPRVALLEGGFDAWSDVRIHAFHWEGGDRVLFACTSSKCRERAGKAAERLERAGVESRMVQAGAARTNDDAMAAAIRPQLRWFFGVDPRWSIE